MRTTWKWHVMCLVGLLALIAWLSTYPHGKGGQRDDEDDPHKSIRAYRNKASGFGPLRPPSVDPDQSFNFDFGPSKFERFKTNISSLAHGIFRKRDK
jgi:hypothetical protein